MRAIIACEESQAVTIALRNVGIEAYSCDIQECSGENPLWHIKKDIFKEMSTRFHVYDFCGGHPPCTYLANSGVRWLISEKEKDGFIYNEKIGKFYNPERWEHMRMGAIFFKSLYSIVSSIGKGYLENPIMHKYAMEIIGVKPTQIIQPYQFGHPESKATCLWVVGLPQLKPTNNVYKAMMELPPLERQKMWAMSPGKDRAKLRSKTYPGIAEAIATQWGNATIQTNIIQQTLFAA